MASRTFELTTAVPVAPEAVIDFLEDLGRHRGLRPFLVSADVVARGHDAVGPWTQWRVTERPKLGPFRYRITFPARMHRTSATSMSGDVRAAPGCSLRTTTEATAHPAPASASTVHEVTVVTAPRLLIGYMTRQAQLAHARTFSLLPRELA
ncbi:MAG: hypothetical protein HIU88_11845 [Acidobacteria bacterium]|nr:hypothetical protein [Acidobacteriota bacterium]